MIATVRHKSSPLPLDDLRQDYDIAKRNSRFRRKRAGVGTVGTSGDYHYASEEDFLYQIELSRDLDRNDSIAGMVIDRILDNIFQDTGICPDPDTGDENLDDLLKAKWQEWASNPDKCDLAGEMTFQEMERMVLRSALVDGDIMALPNEGGAVELMEAHRLRTPKNTSKNVVHGVQLDGHRKRLSYWFTKDDLDPRRALSRVSDTTRIDARAEDGRRQVFHVYNPDRYSLTRGVSCFRRNADMLGMHDDIEFANLVRQQVAACFAVIEETSETGLPGTGVQTGPQTTETSGTTTRTLQGISPGMHVSPGPGKKLTGFSPNIPNPQFFEHVMLVLKIISANLNLPVQVLLLDPSDTNFSGWRGAVDQARMGFRRIQGWLIRKFHKLVYEWKVRTWLAQDQQLETLSKQGGVNPFKVVWNRPKWEYIEPVKDTLADKEQVRGLLTTLRKALARRGEDFDAIVNETVNDNANLYRKARDMARILNAEAESDDEKVHWRELITMPLHDGLSAKLSDVAGADDPEPVAPAKRRAA